MEKMSFKKKCRDMGITLTEEELDNIIKVVEEFDENEKYNLHK